MTVIRTLILGLALAAPGLALAWDFKPAARLNGELSYDSLPPSATWGENGNAFLLPAMQDGNWSILPLFAALATDSANSIEEDSFFVESYTFLAKPQLRYKRGALTYRLWADAKHSFNKQTSGEVWSEGLYDYEEYGVGLGAAWKLVPLSLSAGLEPLHRTYPNYHELGVQVVDNKNYYSKDYNGWKLTLGAESDKDAPLQWSANYTLLLRDYTDSYLIQSPSGKLDTGTLRADQLHRWDGSLQGAWSRHWGWGVNGGVDWNISPEGYFDINQLQFNGDFFGYISENIGGSLTWLASPDGFSLTPSYNVLARNYTGRVVRNPDGEFTQGLQEDVEHRLGLDARWPLRSWVAVTASTSYLSVLSNQAYFLGLRNTYDLFKAGLGLDISY